MDKLVLLESARVISFDKFVEKVPEFIQENGGFYTSKSSSKGYNGDMITLGKRGKKYMNQVKESGNMGTGGGTL